MGSFYAELHVAGHAFPVRRADFSVHQDTDARGRVVGRVRHGPLHVTMDVPRDVAVLEAWAAAPHKPLPGQLVFYDATAQIPQETIAFAAGHCVHYGEDFDNGLNGRPGAYVCHLTITGEVFELLAGGPSARAFPAALAVAAVAKAVTAPAAPGVTSPPAGEVPSGAVVPTGPNYTTVSMDPDYVSEETGAVWGTKVQYLTPTERSAHLLTVGKDGLVYTAAGALFDTKDAATVEEKGKAIFVMAATGEIYASTEHKPGFFHHSSFLAGEPVAAAGELEALDGVIVSVSNRSGHYAPDHTYTHQFIEQLWRGGAKNTDQIKIQNFDQ